MFVKYITLDLNIFCLKYPLVRLKVGYIGVYIVYNLNIV